MVLACDLAIQAQTVESNMVAEELLEIHGQHTELLACDLANEAPGKQQQCFTCAKYLLPDLLSKMQWKKNKGRCISCVNQLTKAGSVGMILQQNTPPAIVLKKELEPICPVHTPWVELTKQHDIKWEHSWKDKYTGLHGGPHPGPTHFIINIVRSAKGLADIFFAIPPLAFFERVAQLTTKYCYDNWVVQRRKKDSDGNKKKKQVYQLVDESWAGIRAILWDVLQKATHH